MDLYRDNLYRKIKQNLFPDIVHFLEFQHQFMRLESIFKYDVELLSQYSLIESSLFLNWKPKEVIEIRKSRDRDTQKRL